MKIVINKSVGGFGLSNFGMEKYIKHKYPNNFIVDDNMIARDNSIYYDMLTDTMISEYDIKRDDSSLIHIIEKYGEEVCGNNANLKIVEVPDGTDWVIDEYDGNETVEEAHRSWS